MAYDAFGASDASDLYALTAPALHAAEDGKRGPTDFALRSQTDGT
jgi:hypothetical protein